MNSQQTKKSKTPIPREPGFGTLIHWALVITIFVNLIVYAFDASATNGVHVLVPAAVLILIGTKSLYPDE